MQKNRVGTPYANVEAHDNLTPLVRSVGGSFFVVFFTPLISAV